MIMQGVGLKMSKDIDASFQSYLEDLLFSQQDRVVQKIEEDNWVGSLIQIKNMQQLYER